MAQRETTEAEDQEILAKMTLQEEPYDDLDRIVGELIGDKQTVPIRLYRTRRGTREEEYITNIPPEVDSVLEYVKDEFGPGSYKVKIYVDGRVKVNQSFNIAEIEKTVAPVMHVQPQQNNLGMQELVMLLSSQQQQFLERMGTMIAGVLQGPSRKEMLDEMLVYKQLFSSGENKGFNPTEALDLLRQGMEFGKELNPSQREPDTNDILLEGLKTFAPIVAGAMAEKQNVVSERKAEATTPQIERSENVHEIVLRQAIGFLVTKAKEGADPSLYAELVLDNAGDDILRVFVADPNWFDQLSQINEEVKSYPEWFGELKKSIIEMLTPIGEGVNTPKHETTDIDNVHGHTPRQAGGEGNT